FSARRERGRDQADGAAPHRGRDPHRERDGGPRASRTRHSGQRSRGYHRLDLHRRRGVVAMGGSRVNTVTDPVTGEQIAVPGANGRGLAHLLSRLRAYLVLDPLIFLWTGICGAISLTGSFFDRGGRFQHAMAKLWSRGILAFSFTPVTVEHGERLQGP